MSAKPAFRKEDEGGTITGISSSARSDGAASQQAVAGFVMVHAAGLEIYELGLGSLPSYPFQR